MKNKLFFDLPVQVQRIINEANASKSKGNYKTYEVYKSLLNELDLSYTQYETAIKYLAEVLRV